MKHIKLAFLLSVALALTACTSISRLVSARIEVQVGTNKVSVTQPKDTTFDRFSINPTNGAIEIQGYASSANAAAIGAAKAQWEATSEIWKSAASLIERAASVAATANGIPLPAPKSKARDDPSTPKLEIPDGFTLVPATNAPTK